MTAIEQWTAFGVVFLVMVVVVCAVSYFLLDDRKP
jgi:hypothetical protein